MKASELRINKRVWAWWLSRYLFYTGESYDGKYIFTDINDDEVIIKESDLKDLEIK